MERVMWIVKLALIGYSLCGYTAPAIADDTLDELIPDQIVSVRITLNPWGANLGFETEVNGDDPKVHLLVAVIGERMRESSGLAARVFNAVGAEGVALRCVSFGATKTNLQMVVPEKLMAKAVRALHKALFTEPQAA